MFDPRKRAIVLALGLGLLALPLGACDEEGPAEEAGENIDDAVDDAGEAIEDAGEAIDDRN